MNDGGDRSRRIPHPAAVPLAEQIACIERELKLRAKVYPNRIACGRMSRRLAEREIDRMRAILETLKTMARAEELPL